MSFSDILIGTLLGAVLLLLLLAVAKVLQILTRRRPITPGRLTIWGFPMLFIAMSAIFLMDPISRQSREQILDRLGIALIFSAPLLAWRLIFTRRYDVTEIGPTPIGAIARVMIDGPAAERGCMVRVLSRSPDDLEFEVQRLDSHGTSRSLLAFALPKDAIEIVQYDEQQIAGGSRYPIRKGTLRFSYLMAALACVCGAGWHVYGTDDRIQAALRFMTLSSAGYALLALQVARMLRSTRWDSAAQENGVRSNR